MLRDESMQTSLQEYNWSDDERSHDTLAVDFWTHNNVLCGMRSGRVRMWDIRANGANVRLQHASCVSHVRAIDENKVLVAGLKNQLALYDLRFIRPELDSSSPKSKGKGKAPPYSDHNPPSLPLHSFPTYRMKEYLYPRLGFDVHRNLVASGTEDKKVQIFDLHSGRELHIGNNDLLPNDTLTGHARCLKFVEHGFGGEGLRLLVANGARIDAWAW
ncbi:MAG: hypothetical protein LQ338_000709 [Usnochroma carphineum]|nr:MAG: hypothetical protein LQ338_000709 [Usnochroma carphineum]